MSEARIIPIAPGRLARRRGQWESRLTASPPLSLYVHFPWCVKKCPYCDFNSHAVRDEGIPEAAYIEALSPTWKRPAADLGPARAQHLHRRRHPQPDQPRRPGRAAHRHPHARAARPDGRDHPRSQPRHRRRGPLRAFRQAGVNRLSVGIQSFNEGTSRPSGASTAAPTPSPPPKPRSPTSRPSTST
jgi:oxygen-independent coproporphyrinogen-3 oxidase